MKKELLKFNLQNFAEGEENTPPAEPKTFTQEEVDAQVNAVIGKERARSEKALKNMQDQLQTLQQAQDLAGLNEQEQLQKKLDDEMKKREALEKEINATTIKNEALSIFSERELPASMINLVMTDDAESTLERINVLDAEVKKLVETRVQNEVDKRLKGTPPQTGKMDADLANNPFLTDNITAQMQLMKSNPELATKLKEVAKNAKKN